MSDQWYLAKNKKKHGPYSFVQMKTAAASGNLLPDDMIFNEGTTKWVTAGSVNGLFPAVVKSVPPPPPVDTSSIAERVRLAQERAAKEKEDAARRAAKEKEDVARQQAEIVERRSIQWLVNLKAALSDAIEQLHFTEAFSVAAAILSRNSDDKEARAAKEYIIQSQRAAVTAFLTTPYFCPSCCLPFQFATAGNQVNFICGFCKMELNTFPILHKCESCHVTMETPLEACDGKAIRCPVCKHRQPDPIPYFEVNTVAQWSPFSLWGLADCFLCGYCKAKLKFPVSDGTRIGRCPDCKKVFYSYDYAKLRLQRQIEAQKRQAESQERWEAYQERTSKVIEKVCWQCSGKGIVGGGIGGGQERRCNECGGHGVLRY